MCAGATSPPSSARARTARSPEYRQLLSIKAAYGGSGKYLLDGRRLCVDDDTFAILNQGRAYGMSPRELRSGIADSLRTSSTRELNPNSDEVARRQQ